jgi:hypothetical protein
MQCSECGVIFDFRGPAPNRRWWLCPTCRRQRAELLSRANQVAHLAVSLAELPAGALVEVLDGLSPATLDELVEGVSLRLCAI